MLEGLDSIDWQHLTHAYGPATDVPDLLRALQSPNEEIREEAHTQLYISICHQGTIYDATAYAVPFLIELLNRSSGRDMKGILNLLVGIAKGSSYLDAHKSLVSFEDERNAPEFQAKLAEELEWVQRAHEAVSEGLPVYMELLSHQEADVCMMAVYLLSFFNEHREKTLPELHALIAKETDVSVKATALLSLGTLLGSDAPQCQVLWTFLAAEHPLLRFVAALTLARYAREATPSAAINILVDAVADADALDRFYASLPQPGRVVSLVRNVLFDTGTALGVPALIAVLQKLPAGVGDLTVLDVASSLMDLAFYGEHTSGGRLSGWTRAGRVEFWPDPSWQQRPIFQNEAFDNSLAEGGHSASLLEAQRAALQALVDCELLWKIDSNFCELYGLPNSREALRNLLAQ